MNNIIHFNGEEFSLNEINNIMKEKNEQYYTVTFENKNELHIVKHNTGYFKINKLIIELFNYYKDKNIFNENINIKGNDNFSIIYNIKSEKLLSNIKNNLNKLLKNK